MNSKRLASLLAATLALLIAAILAHLALRKDRSPTTMQTRIVTVAGATECSNLSMGVYSWLAAATNDGPARMPVRPRDLLQFQNKGSDRGGWFPYGSMDGERLELSTGPGRLYVAGRPVFLKLSNSSDNWKWLADAPEGDLACLRTISIDGAIGPEQRHALERLAAANVNLCLELLTPQAADIALPLFRPRVLWLPTSRAYDPTALEGKKELEELWLDAESFTTLDFLSSIPDLRRLCIPEMEPKRTVPIPDCRNLRSLMLGDSRQLSAIHPSLKRRLVELEVFAWSAEAVKGLSEFTALRSLLMGQGDSDSDLRQLPTVERLVRYAPHREITQAGFSSALSHMPDLEELYLVNCEGITDLRPLASTPRLERLVLLKSEADLAPLLKMDGLRFLALDKDLLESSPPELAELRRALPNCTVVAGEPFCLGSGWIVAVLAVVFLPRLRRRRA